MTAHSTLGASSAHRWLVCAGSVKLSEGQPDSTSEYAAEGTKAHDLAHAMLDQYITYVDPEDEEMLWYVERYVEYVQALGGVQHYEVRVAYDNWVPNGFGTSDAIVFDGDTMHVVDLKYGKGVAVSPIDNEQGMLYALGAYQAYAEFVDIKTISIHIVQPRLESFLSWDLTVEELLRFADFARQRALETQEDNAPLFPDAKACKFCRAKAICPALATQNMNAAQLEFDQYVDEDAVQTLPTIDELTVAQQSYIYQHRSAINDMMTAIEQNLTRELNHGREVPEYKLVTGRSTRKWVSEEEAEAAMRKVSKVKVADIFTKKMISPAKAEKLLGKNHPILTDYVSKGNGSPTLVSASDKRPAIESELLTTFGEYNG